MASTLFTQNIIACVWDFDKTLIPAYMQAPLFRRYGVDEATFWAETNALAENYRRRGYHISPEISYLNHLLTYVLSGQMAGLNNKILRECGKEIQFYPGLPDFFTKSRAWAKAKPEYVKHDIQLRHYVVSTGLAEMVRGSALAPFMDAVWACEFIENPLQPGFLKQNEFPLEAASEIAQIGVMIDNTTKTRAIFEINKGTNRNPAIDVNAKVTPEDRRIPLQNMIYIADGPSDVPSFSVVKQGGGKTYAVYNPANRAEFEQNDRLRHKTVASIITVPPIIPRTARRVIGCICKLRKCVTASSPIAKLPSPRVLRVRRVTSTLHPKKKPPNAPRAAKQSSFLE